jgi:hypothetical protein
MDGGNILGPYLVTADEWDPRDGHTMLARVNGEEWSWARRGDVPRLRSHRELHRMGETLHRGRHWPGTSAQVAGWNCESSQPRRRDRAEIDGIGVLRNRFVKK